VDETESAPDPPTRYELMDRLDEDTENRPPAHHPPKLTEVTGPTAAVGLTLSAISGIRGDRAHQHKTVKPRLVRP
jgi:hypothetical protein